MQKSYFFNPFFIGFDVKSTKKTPKLRFYRTDYVILHTKLIANSKFNRK